MVMVRYDYRYKHHDTNKQHHILVYFLFHSHTYDTKLLQKSEMRKVIVIELSYKGFS